MFACGAAELRRYATAQLRIRAGALCRQSAVE
jgi:hypothetical protein